MPDYKKSYFNLAGILADVLEDLDELVDILKTALCEGEEELIENVNSDVK